MFDFGTMCAGIRMHDTVEGTHILAIVGEFADLGLKGLVCG